LSQSSGLVFELYLPFGFCTVCWHIVCLAYLIKVACRTNAPVPWVPFTLFTSANPVGPYYGTLRDAVAAGVLAQYCYQQHERCQIIFAGFCCFVTVFCMFLPNPFIYRHMHSFHDFQGNFWPIFMAAKRLECAPGKAGQQQESKDNGTQWYQLLRPVFFFMREPYWKDSTLPLLDKQTRWHTRAQALYGDIPQATVWLLFMFFCASKFERPFYLTFTTFLAGAKSFFVYRYRSWILCQMAINDVPWSHLIPNDVRWAVRCNESDWAVRCNHCTNAHKSKACRNLLKDEETTPEVRAEAMKGLGKIYEALRDEEVRLTDEKEVLQIKKEVLQIKNTILWEAATSEEEKTRKQANDLLEKLFDKETFAKCHKAQVELHRLRSDDPDEMKDAMKKLAKEHQQFASAFVRDLTKLLEHPSRSENDRKAENREEEAKIGGDIRKVREAAARALGLLSKYDDPEVSAAVARVADDVLKLFCDGGNRFLCSAALTAVVGFRGDAAVKAVDKAVELFVDEKLRDDPRRKLAEIALVELLPHLRNQDGKLSKDKVREIAQKLLGSGYSREAGRNVLSRLGGEAAEAVLTVLRGTEAREEEEWFKAVLECQDKSARRLVSGHSTGLNLVLDTDEASMEKARDLVKRVNENPRDVFKLLENEKILRSEIGGAPENTGTLPFFMTDLEADDIMFIAEMWTYLRDRDHRGSVHTPLVVFSADPEKKDKDEIFGMKILLAALILGRVDLHIVTPKHDKGSITSIAKKIKEFHGKVEYYICAPARGNLKHIVDSLTVKKDKEEPQFSGPQRRSVHLYSGSYNMKKSTEDDLSALSKLVGKDNCLTDLSKFPFFGYDESVYTNFADFALPSFAPLLSHRYTLIAAVWRLLNDAFNTKLVSPEKVMEKVLPPDLEEKFSEAKVHYAKDMKKYAEIVCTPKLLEHVVNKKKNTLKAFACGSCDVPLCDQLLFLREWARDHQPPVPRDLNNRPETEGTWISEISGTWVYNKKDGYTSVDTRPEVETMGLKAVQPVMREHRDAEALYRMREALQDYTFKHLELLYGENRC